MISFIGPHSLSLTLDSARESCPEANNFIYTALSFPHSPLVQSEAEVRAHNVPSLPKKYYCPKTTIFLSKSRAVLKVSVTMSVPGASLRAWWQHLIIPDYVAPFLLEIKYCMSVSCLIWVICHLIIQTSNGLVSIFLLMYFAKGKLHPFSVLFYNVLLMPAANGSLTFYTISFIAALFLSDSSSWASDNAHVLYDANLTMTSSFRVHATLMLRWWIRHLEYSQLYYVWKSFGMPAGMREWWSSRPTLIFLKIMNFLWPLLEIVNRFTAEP